MNAISVAEGLKTALQSTAPLQNWKNLEEEVRNLVVGRNLDGTLQLAGIRSNNLARSSMQTIKGQKITGWTEWLSLGRYFLFLDQPTDEENILTIANNKDGRLEIFGIGQDSAVWHIWQTSPSSNTWSEWNKLYGTQGNNQPLQNVANIMSLSDKSGYIHVIGMDTSNTLYHSYQVDGAWIGWTDLPTLTTNAGALALAFNSSDALEVYTVGNDGHIWSSTQSAKGSSTWSAWSELLGTTGNKTPISNSLYISALNDTDGYIHVLASDSQNTTISHAYQVTGGLNGWESLPSLPVEVTSVVNLTAEVNSSGLIETFVVSQQGSMYRITQAASKGNNWAQSWEKLDGNFVRACVDKNLEGELTVFGEDPQGNVWKFEKSAQISADPCIAYVIDSSGSMDYHGYMGFAKSAACAFTNILQVNNGCAVVEFGSTAAVVQPLVYALDQDHKNSVCTAINTIRASGGTNVEAGIRQGHGQVGSLNSPKGMLLVGDGYYNMGGDPTKNLPSLPVYTVALGSQEPETQIMMHTIATKTSGHYNYAQHHKDLPLVFNDIVQQSNLGEVIINEQALIPKTTYPMPGRRFTPSSGNPLTLVISWDNPAVTLNQDTTVDTNEIQVQVTQWIQDIPDAVYTGEGFAVFYYQYPMVLDWDVALNFGGQTNGQDLTVTFGAFQTPGSEHLEVNFDKQVIKAGEPAVIHANFFADDDKLEGAGIRASINAPTIDVEGIEKKYAGELEKITPDNVLLEDGVPENIAKILTMQKQKGEMLFTRTEHPNLTFEEVNGVPLIRFDKTQVKGSYSVHVTGQALTKNTQRTVQRTRLLHFIVE
jgi:hypothetical protein